MKAKTCWLSTLTNVSTVVSVNPSAPPMRSVLTLSLTWKNGLNSTASIPKCGRLSSPRKTSCPRPMRWTAKRARWSCSLRHPEKAANTLRCGM
ncbi:UNVERIFIED_CONTAM: hypothetical protein GTU68_025475 [Idotea baltica]|nr:hypothetical protein [Idotea baltica]